MRTEKTRVADKLRAEEARVADRKRAESYDLSAIEILSKLEQVGEVQTGPADDIQVDPARSKSSLVNQIRIELKAEDLYNIRRDELSYEVQIRLA
ncbi:formin-like protein 11 [Dorcoceras hygrometricum]|uniref:Formin-like protein 11 n=1 Tax=Dorcoceras hygrometricum TaxID=472368 RepID=A0A2Z7DK30_9LAMI|nr:formin-like protein 11 [Dorcoceras hygrometricum]